MRGVILDSETGKVVLRPTTVDLLREMSVNEKDPERRRSLLGIADNLTLGAEEPYLKASKQFWRQFDMQSPMIADATAVAGTSEAILYPAEKSFLPAYYWYTGKTAVLTMAGKITTASSSQGNITLTLRYGTTTGGTSLAADAAEALAASKTNITWWFDAIATCRSDGASGSVIAVFKFAFDGKGAIFTTAADSPQMGPATAPAATTVDCTATSGLVVTATLGSASDSMTAQILTIESIN